MHLGIEEIQICNVVHCPDAFAISVKHSTGWKVVFSGDTRPCPQLDRIGQDCTVLIHEATFEDNLSTEAVEKRHSTTTEAIQSAINMNAKFLLMNHFSQRYPKIPVFDSKYNNRTGVTFDLMSVRPEMFHKLPSFLPSLSRIHSSSLSLFCQSWNNSLTHVALFWQICLWLKPMPTPRMQSLRLSRRRYKSEPPSVPKRRSSYYFARRRFGPFCVPLLSFFCYARKKKSTMFN